MFIIDAETGLRTVQHDYVPRYLLRLAGGFVRSTNRPVRIDNAMEGGKLPHAWPKAPAPMCPLLDTHFNAYARHKIDILYSIPP